MIISFWAIPPIHKLGNDLGLSRRHNFPEIGWEVLMLAINVDTDHVPLNLHNFSNSTAAIAAFHIVTDLENLADSASRGGFACF